MDKCIIERTLNEANTLLEGNYTVREIAKIFKVSKSTVHKDLQQRLYMIDKNIHALVSRVFENHISTRHIKGGEATKKKYLELK